MATELLPIASGPGTSADIVVAAGTQVTLGLKSTAGPDTKGGRIKVQIKADNNEYFDIDELSWPNRVALVVIGAGTFRLSRVDKETACGAFRD